MGLSVLGFCLFPGFAPAADISGQWGGHVRLQGSTAWYDSTHLVTLSRDTGSYCDGSVDARLTGTLFAGPRLTLDVHYEAVFSGGETRKAFRALIQDVPQATSYFSGPPSDDRRLFSLTHVITEKDDRVAYHRLDRLSATYTGDRVMVRAGRQALTWGNGLVFNPADRLNPFAPADVIRDYKIGDDMVLVQGAWDLFSDLQLVYVPRRDPDTGKVRWDESSLAGKVAWSAAGADWNLMAARHFKDNVFGVGMVRYVGDAAWRTDVTWTAVDGDFGDGYVSAVTNLDYSWVWAGHNWYGLAEVYFSGLGRHDPMDAMTDPDLLQRLERGDLFTLGRWYGAAQVQFEAHPLVNFFLSTIVNLDDPSMLVQPRIVWDVLASTRIMAGVDLPVGSAGTEYGGLKVPAVDRTAGAPVRVYLIATWYF